MQDEELEEVQEYLYPGEVITLKKDYEYEIKGYIKIG